MIAVKSRTFTPSSGNAMWDAPCRPATTGWPVVAVSARIEKNEEDGNMWQYARVAALALGAGLLAPIAVFSQAYPAKPVRVVIPWPPGGSNDIVGRVVFQRMAEQLGQQFVIENR